MTKSRTLLALGLAVAGLFASGDAGALEDRIAVGEVSVVTPAPGLDPVTLKTAAEGEVLKLDQARLSGKKRYVVSLAVIRSSDGPVSCEITAMLREAKSGSMLAVIQGRARAEGNTSNPELRAAVLRAAVRTAVSQIPEALKGGS